MFSQYCYFMERRTEECYSWLLFKITAFYSRKVFILFESEYLGAKLSDLPN
jgi:hypothetical protein